MAKALIPDELWSLIAAHLPLRPPFQSRPSKDCQAGLVSVQGNYTPTVLMHPESTVPDCASEALLHASRDMASSHAHGLAAGVGLSNEPLGGSTDFADCGSATSRASVPLAACFSSFTITKL